MNLVVAARQLACDDAAVKRLNDGRCAVGEATNVSPEAEPIGLLLRHVLSSVTQQASQALAPMGLTDAQWRPLLRLHFNDGLTVAELVRELQMDAGGATRMLDRLEAKGLCERARSETDRRIVHVRLTEKGREVAQQIPATVVQVMDRHLAGFRAEEQELLRMFLQRMLKNGASVFAVLHDRQP